MDAPVQNGIAGLDKWFRTDLALLKRHKQPLCYILIKKKQLEEEFLQSFFTSWRCNEINLMQHYFTFHLWNDFECTVTCMRVNGVYVSACRSLVSALCDLSERVESQRGITNDVDAANNFFGFLSLVTAFLIKRLWAEIKHFFIWAGLVNFYVLCCWTCLMFWLLAKLSTCYF